MLLGSEEPIANLLVRANRAIARFRVAYFKHFAVPLKVQNRRSGVGSKTVVEVSARIKQLILG